jgi:ABC-type dipeptide/oligopeptide/nickel transport system permease subunit
VKANPLVIDGVIAVVIAAVVLVVAPGVAVAAMVAAVVLLGCAVSVLLDRRRQRHVVRPRRSAR